MNLAWGIARGRLAGERLLHTEGAAKAVLELAPLFGADPQKAVIAAVLHDIARDVPQDELVRLAQAKGIMIRKADEIVPLLLHGRVAAAIAGESGISDPEVLDAVSWHPAGRPGWTGLVKAVFLADKVEETRKYPGAQRVRQLLRTGKPRSALRQALRNAIKHSADRSPFFVDPETVVVFNEVSQSLSQEPER